MRKIPQRCLNWVVALKPEARPLIQSLELKKWDSGGGGFEVYRNESLSHYLIITGVGKINAASAVGWLAGLQDQQWSFPVWINFGIGGNRKAAIGSIFRGGRIRDEATGKSWYPPSLSGRKGSKGLKSIELLTIDKPRFDYPEENWTLEMEASGFVASAVKFATLEWIHSLKVVSDNQDSDPNLIKPKWVSELCESVIPDAIGFANSIEGQAASFLEQVSGYEIDDLVSNYRFSETEKHQLQRLIQRAFVLGKLSDFSEIVGSSELESGKSILKRLRWLLSDTKSAED